MLEIVNEIDNLPLNETERNAYKNNIANVYQIALLENVELAKEYGTSLKNKIEKNLVIRKKQELYLPTIVALIIIVILVYILYRNNLIGDIVYPLIYGSIGGLLSMIIQNRDIDYKVEDKFLYFEGFKLILLCNIMAIVGYIAIESKIILGNIDLNSSKYLYYLIYIICGYSQTFIPNMLKNFEIENLQK